MFKKIILTHQLKWLFVGTILTVGASFETKPALAGCNFHGCSQSSVAECNFHGCPNAPMGAECNFHGCPPSPQPVNNNSAPSVPDRTVIVVPTSGGQSSNSGGSGKAIAECMERLLYRQGNYGRIRTEISETTAVQACQNAR